MPADRKWFELILPEVRKPAGYGNLVQVIAVDEDHRELWFPYEEEPTILRCVQINVADGTAGKPKIILTKGVRARGE